MVLILVVDKSAGVAMVPVYLFGRGCFDTPEILSGDLPNRPESYLETFDAVDCCTVVRSLESVKTDEKMNVFWDIDFGRILGGFWEGFGMPKSLIFAVFSMFFRYKIWTGF